MKGTNTNGEPKEGVRRDGRSERNAQARSASVIVQGFRGQCPRMTQDRLENPELSGVRDWDLAETKHLRWTVYALVGIYQPHSKTVGRIFSVAGKNP